MISEELLTEVKCLEKLRKSRVLVYCSTEVAGHNLDARDIRVVYEALKSIKPRNRLDLVLNVEGGAVSAGRRLAVLLHEMCKTLSVLVPHRARSAGALVAIAGHEILMGPCSELGPIDPLLRSLEDGRGKSAISSESLRALTAFSQEWLALDSASARLEVLRILCTHIFPTSLGEIFLADRYLRRVAVELISHHLPGAGRIQRERIVDKLVTRYPDHSHGLTRSDLTAMGLKVKLFSDAECKCVDRIYKHAQAYMQGKELQSLTGKRPVKSIIFCSEYEALWISDWVSTKTPPDFKPDATVTIVPQKGGCWIQIRPRMQGRGRNSIPS